MFDIAWSELLLVGVVALVVIGPRDLPKAMLNMGRMARQLRQLAHGVRQQWDQLAYEAEVAADAELRRKQAAENPESAGVATSSEEPHEPK